MDPARWDRLEELLAAGAQLPASDRPAFVERETSADPELRTELSTLLAVYDRSADFVSRMRGEVFDSRIEAILREVPASSDVPDPWIGRTVAHYEISDRIGGGGMGVIYRARDLRLHRQVALKFIAPELWRDADARRRFQEEARAASALDHPNICTIHDFGETDDGRSFLVMAAYDGETLRERIARGPLAPTVALDLSEQIGQALAAAHQRGIVHRDVKPDNVFVTRDGVVKLLDFGLAGTRDAGGEGGLAGTIAYMSPEQAEGRRADERSDVWALGVVLYEMLAGVHPFAAERRSEVMHRILSDKPDMRHLAAGMPEGADAVIARALAKDPEIRFADGSRFVEALRECRPEGPSAHNRGRARLRPIALATAAAVGLMLLVAAVWPRSAAMPAAAKGALPARAAGAVSHVLWVDDNPTHNEELIRQLQAHGIAVTTALSTGEALARYAPAVHGLVISDMGRYEGPGQQYVARAGIELLEQLRARHPGVSAVIYTSARSARVYRDEALSAGALASVSDEAELLRLLSVPLPRGK